MSISKKIPGNVRDRLANDPFMLVCALSSEQCRGNIQWHHATPEFGQTYRLDDWWSILPLCEWHHAHVSKPKFAQRVREILFQRKLMA